MAVQIGFVGAGWVAGEHLKSLGKIPEARVAAVTDVDADKAARAAAQVAGAAAYTDHEQMLEEQELDAVYVCVPPHVHGDIELAVIERGIPFFLEKPLANELATPRRILKAVREADLLTSVGYLMRYRETVSRAKELLAESVPVVARGTYVCDVPPPPWWRRKEQSGGQVVEQSTHVVDLARYLLGEVESVFCVRRRDLLTDLADYTADDASICSLRFESGLICEVTSSCAMQKARIGLEVLTRTGRLELSTGQLDLAVETDGETHTYCSTDDVFLAEDQAFIEAVQSGERGAVLSDYADAFRTQTVTCAANESMASGELVTIEEP